MSESLPPCLGQAMFVIKDKQLFLELGPKKRLLANFVDEAAAGLFTRIFDVGDDEDDKRES